MGAGAAGLTLNVSGLGAVPFASVHTDFKLIKSFRSTYMSSFSIALSGLTASSSDLDITANNIANADTVGFKESRAEFADVYASGAVNLNTSVTGEGVRLASTAQQFTQGNISTSSSNLDLAISGDGFFTLKSRERHRLFAQRPVCRGLERQRGEFHRPGAAGLSAAGQRRLQHRRFERLELADRAERPRKRPPRER